MKISFIRLENLNINYGKIFKIKSENFHSKKSLLEMWKIELYYALVDMTCLVSFLNPVSGSSNLV